MGNILVQMSGGYDSTAVAVKLLEEGNNVYGIFINYGQIYYKQELDAVENLNTYFLEKYKNYKGFDIINTNIQLSRNKDGSPSDYIPIRNFVLGSLTANYALSKGYDVIAVGNKTTVVRKNDPWSFSDCSYEFYKRMNEIIDFSTEEGDSVKFIMPLLIDETTSLTKSDIINIINNSGVNFNILWSCYHNSKLPCGVCYHCLENKKAFKESGVKDPIKYEVTSEE